jgi:hypothetical protein
MSFDKIIAVTGKPGLFSVLTQTRSGFLVESLLDGKKQSLDLRSNVSLLSEISVYTYSGEIKLVDIFKLMFEYLKGEASLSHKESKEVLERFFRTVLPEYDESRVYPSDFKKIVQWYNLLLAKERLVFEEVSE